MEQKLSVGTHVLADLSGIDAAILNDGRRILRCLRQAVEEIGLTVLSEAEHQFTVGGEGYTGILLLSESHASIHTYPEHRYLAVDIFSCGEIDPNPALESLIEYLQPTAVARRSVTRAAQVTSEGIPSGV